MGHFVNLEQAAPAPVDEAGVAELAARREAHVVAVAPGVVRADDGVHGRVGEAADAGELLAHDALLGGELGGVLQVLELAAAAVAEEGALRLHAAAGGFEHVRDDAFDVVLVDALDLDLDELPGSGEGGHERLAVGQAGEAAPARHDPLDANGLEALFLGDLLPAAPAASHGASVAAWRGVGRTALVEGAGGGEPGDALVVVAEDLLEYLLGVLADGRGLADAGGRAGEAEARALDDRLAVEGEWGTRTRWPRCASCGSSTALPARMTAWAGTPAACRIASASAGVRCAVQAEMAASSSSCVGEASREGGVARVVREVGALDDGAEALPAGIVADGDRDPVIVAAGGVDAVGGHVGVAVAHAGQGAAAQLVVEQVGADELDGALDLGVVDVLPFPVRRRWSRAASRPARRKRGAMVSV